MLTAAKLLTRYAALEPAARPEKRRRPHFIERIDLLRPDADQRFARYAMVVDSADCSRERV